MIRLLTTLAFLSLAVLGFGTPARAQYVNYTYTTLDYPGANYSEANGIDAAGHIVGDYSTNGGTTVHAFVLNGGVYTSFDVPGNIGYSSANGMNASGQIVGIYYGGAGGKGRAYLKTGGTYTELVPYSGSSFTQALSINDASHVVGSYRDAGDVVRGFLYDGVTYTPLTGPSATNTVAIGINNAETVVGTFISGGVSHGFVLSGGVYSPFDAPGAVATIAEGINDTGQIAGFYQNASSAYHSFVLDGTHYTPLDVPGATLTQAFAINNAQQVVGYFESASGSHGFLATPHSVFPGDVNYDGLVNIFDINSVSSHWGGSGPAGDANEDKAVNIFDINLISAHWSSTSGGGATSVPEPCSMVLAAIGCLGLLVRRLRKTIAARIVT